MPSVLSVLCAQPAPKAYHRCMVELGAFRAPIGHLRSCQHKLARRGEVELMRQCVALQVSALPSAASDYCRTIVCEDVGLAQPGLARLVARVSREIRQLLVSQPYPLRLSVADAVLRLNLALAEAVCRAPKSRLVPELRSAVLLQMEQKEGIREPKRSIEWRLDQLRSAIAVCRANPAASLEGREIREAVRCLLEARVHMGGSEMAKVVPIWKVIEVAAPGPVIKALKELHAAPGGSGSLALHMAVWVACFRQEHADEPQLPVVAWEPSEALERFVLPAYALDKHVGRGGGYERFYAEGCWSPPELRWEREVDDRLRAEALEWRRRVPESGYEATVRRLRVKAGWEQSKESKKRCAEAAAAVSSVSKQAKVAPPLSAPILQQLTGRGKKFVFLGGSAGLEAGWVYKGPYDRVKDAVRLKRNQVLARRLAEVDAACGLERPLVLPPPEVVAVPGVSGVFLRWRNVGREVPAAPAERLSNGCMAEAAVLPRGAVAPRIQDLAPSELSPAICLAVLQHLYARALLGIGDAGPWNVLLGADGRVYGIDLEELRAAKSEPPVSWQQFLAPKRLGHEALFAAVVRQVRRLPAEAAERLLHPEERVAWQQAEKLWSEL